MGTRYTIIWGRHRPHATPETETETETETRTGPGPETDGETRPPGDLAARFRGAAMSLLKTFHAPIPAAIGIATDYEGSACVGRQRMLIFSPFSAPARKISKPGSRAFMRHGQPTAGCCMLALPLLVVLKETKKGASRLAQASAPSLGGSCAWSCRSWKVAAPVLKGAFGSQLVDRFDFDFYKIK